MKKSSQKAEKTAKNTVKTGQNGVKTAKTTAKSTPKTENTANNAFAGVQDGDIFDQMAKETAANLAMPSENKRVQYTVYFTSATTKQYIAAMCKQTGKKPGAYISEFINVAAQQAKARGWF